MTPNLSSHSKLNFRFASAVSKGKKESYRNSLLSNLEIQRLIQIQARRKRVNNATWPLGRDPTDTGLSNM